MNNQSLMDLYSVIIGALYGISQNNEESNMAARVKSYSGLVGKSYSGPVGAIYSEPGCDAPGIQTESTLRERLEKAWATLGEALSNIRSINYKLFMPEPCNAENGKIGESNTENIENLICLIESIAAKIETETREISSGI
jgi:hypothetical protein